MDPALVVIQAIVRHDDQILPVEILDKIDALSIDDIPSSHRPRGEIDDAFLASYQDDVRFEVQQYYKTMFSQYLPIDDWIKVIRTRMFPEELYIAPLLQIYEDKSITPFVRERQMNQLLQSLAGVIYDRHGFLHRHLSFDDWTRFITYARSFRSHDLFRLLHLVGVKKEVRSFQLKNIEHDFRFFSFIQRWKNVEIHSAYVARHYFDEGSHYEDEIFYCENRTAHEITYVEYDGTRVVGNENLFQEHASIANTSNWKEYILTVSLSQFNTLYLNEFRQILQRFSPTTPLPKYQGTLHDYLKLIHNLIGRIHPDFPCTIYHESLSRYLDRLNMKELYFASENILFPELRYQDISFIEMFQKKWTESLSYFINLFLYHIEKDFLPVPKPFSIQSSIEPMKHVNIEFLSLIHSKNQRYFNMEPPSLWTDNAEEHYEMQFCRNALDALFFDLKDTKKL